jgi:hypothetical protein
MAKARMAGKALEALKWLFKGDDAGQIALRVIPDVGFGVLEGALTPGDIGDKIIAGSSTAVGSLAGGIGLGKLGGNSMVARQLLDISGSVGGDFAGRAVGDMIQRGKDKVSGGKGQTAYERLSEEQFNALKEEASRQALAELGLLPQGYQSALVDPYSGMGVS